MQDYTQFFISQIMERIQELDEIGGANSPEQYIAVLTAVKAEISKRIYEARSQLKE